MNSFHKNSYNRYYKDYKKTAFNWGAYTNRCCSLILLKEDKIHVDTLIETRDGYSDTIHWQVFSALCPGLMSVSILKELDKNHKYAYVHRNLKWYLRLPRRINGLLAKKLIDCAYGERLYLTKATLCQLYSLSNRYNIDYALNLCLNYAKDLIDSHNCIRLLQLSIKHEHQKLRKAAYSMIRINFKKVVQCNQDFHLLPFNILKELLLDDFLKINEDEEFAWLAIVRWLSSKSIPPRNLIEMYNQMVKLPTYRTIEQQQQLVTQGFSTTISHFNDPLNYHPLSSNVHIKPVKERLEDDDFLFKILSIKDFPKQVKNKESLLELLKCLRFMRFRSVSSFTVMLSHKAIENSKRLIELIEYMKLRYIIRKNLPFDKECAKKMLPEGYLSHIKRSEKTKSQRVVDSLTKLVSLDAPTIIPAEQSLKRVGQDSLTTFLPAVALNNNQKETPTPIKLSETILKELNKDYLRLAQEPRVPSSVAFLIGGWSDGAVSKSVLAYDFVCDKWFKLNIRLPEARCFHASCSSLKTGEIFILGGTNGEQILNSVLRFQPTQDVSLRSRCKRSQRGKCELCSSKQYHGLSYKFHSLRPMTEKRCHLSSVFHTDGKVYALGGHNGQQRLRSGECYDQVNDEWLRIAEMTIARSDASACSHENKIFIAGGQIGDQYIQASVEFYKANDNTWTFAAPMIVPRMSFRLVSYKTHLLAIGGTNGLMGGDEIGSLTRTVERYDANLSSWSLCAPMLQKRSSFDVVHMENKLMVVGGNGGRHRLKSCESLMIGVPAAQTMALTSFRSGVQSPLAPAQQVSRWHSNPPPLQFTSSQANRANLRDFTLFGERNSSQQTRQVVGGMRENVANSNLSPLRSAMRWEKRAKLPSKRSGFSISVVECPLSNAREFTYHGAKSSAKYKVRQSGGKLEGRRISVVKQKSRWHKFKFIKRRKLIKHLKIALVISIVILIM